MDFKKQSAKLPVINFDLLTQQQKKLCNRHGKLLPNSIRAVFCGPSNCGKTNALLSLIVHPNGLTFENIYVYSKSLNQPKYKFLEQLVEPLEGIEYLPFGEHDLVISPDEALPNSIFVFDDIACEKQDNVKAFYCMGRHKSVDCFYLCQSYAQVPKHLVRDNVNLLIIFRQDDMNLKHVYSDHVNTDMTYQRFKDICSMCWNDGNHSFLVIDKDRDINDGRYRKGFDQFIINIQNTE